MGAHARFRSGRLRRRLSRSAHARAMPTLPPGGWLDTESNAESLSISRDPAQRVALRAQRATAPDESRQGAPRWPRATRLGPR
eukprot:6127726-Prymnesium_polylepis.1